MRSNIRKIYQLRACLQVQRIVYFQLLLIYIKVLKETLESVNVDDANGTATYTTTEGGGRVVSTENLNNGKYEARFKTGSAARINTVEAEGAATVIVPEAYYDPSTNKALTEYPADTLSQRSVDLKSGQEVLFDMETNEPVISGSQKALYTIYGVEVLIAKPLDAVLVDNVNEIDYGYSLNDLKVSYTIQPEEYKASFAYVALKENEVTTNKITSETYVAGEATYAEGYQFNVYKKYEVQVVLNPGAGTEIKSKAEELMVAEMSIVNVVDDEIEELRYSDGTKDMKKYRIRLDIGRMMGAINCEEISAQISTRQQDGNYAAVPDAETYPGNYVTLSFDQGEDLCISKNIDVDKGDRNTFIITNLSNERLGSITDEVAPLYGGLGNKFRVRFLGPLNGAMVDVPIEPVGVIVIAIDGLRQDVLYPDTMDGAPFENVNDPNGDYYIDARDLAGLGQILIGNPTDSSSQQYIMLPEVTSVFPSITLASWASVFTGKMPGETGILGNEFFARDLYADGWESIPGMASHGLPRGMITLSDGAFSNSSVDFFVKNLLPAHNYSPTTYEKELSSAPVNALDPEAQTIYEWIRDDESIAQKMSLYFKSTIRENVDHPYGPEYCNPVKSAVFFNHYGRGADWWGTVDLNWWEELGVDLGVGDKFKEVFVPPIKASKTLDETPTKEAMDFLDKHYTSECSDVRFPALFSLYYGGPDHYGHDIGLNGYSSGYTSYELYFKYFTDMKIEETITRLKDLGEFDNKIFIITSDHGHTAMPTDLRFKYGTWLGIFDNYEDADTSCELKLEFVDPKSSSETYKLQMAEKENNNLHIWELRTLFANFVPSTAGIKLLAPTELNNTDVNITQDSDAANVVSALNGPMAHIYVKGSTWQSDPDATRLGIVIDALIRVLSSGENASDKVKKEFDKLIASIDIILVRRSLNGSYEVVTGISEDVAGTVTINTTSLESLDNSKYINAVERITGMNHKDRSGDIVLIMRDSMNDVNQRFTTGVSCKSWHGGLNNSDSYVPFIVAYPGGNRDELNSILNIVCPDNNCDSNRRLSDLVKEIIKHQYTGQ